MGHVLADIALSALQTVADTDGISTAAPYTACPMISGKYFGPVKGKVRKGGADGSMLPTGFVAGHPLTSGHNATSPKAGIKQSVNKPKQKRKALAALPSARVKTQRRGAAVPPPSKQLSCSVDTSDAATS